MNKKKSIHVHNAVENQEKKIKTKRKPLFTWTWEKKNLKKWTNGGKKTKIIALTEKKNKIKLHNSMNNKITPQPRNKQRKKFAWTWEKENKPKRKMNCTYKQCKD